MRAIVVLALLALAGCTDAPMCRYWADVSIGRGLIDESAVPMLPDNPAWTTKDAAAPASAQDPCSGQPGHPGPGPG